MRKKNRLLAVASAASLASILSAALTGAAATPAHASTLVLSSASSAGGSFDLYTNNDSVEVFGTVTFNSNGSATIKADAANNSASGYEPFLEIDWYAPEENYTYRSAAIGVGQVGSLPTYTTPSNPQVESVQVIAEYGKSGRVYGKGQSKLFQR